MAYTFDIIGLSPICTLFEYQQKMEQNPYRSTTYLGSYQCTLDDFIKSTDLIPKKPEWNWDEVVATMVNFWLKNEASINEWKSQLAQASQDNLIIGRIANVESLRYQFEVLLHEK